MQETGKNILVSKNVQNTLKFGLITILALFLFVPKFMIMDLIRERESQSQIVIDQVSDDWAKQQIIQGPLLLVQYETIVAIQKDKQKISLL